MSSLTPPTSLPHGVIMTASHQPRVFYTRSKSPGVSRRSQWARKSPLMIGGKRVQVARVGVNVTAPTRLRAPHPTNAQHR